MDAGQAISLASFFIVNFFALSISLYGAASFRLKGMVLWVACLEIYFFLINCAVLVLGISGLLRLPELCILIVVPGII